MSYGSQPNRPSGDLQNTQPLNVLRQGESSGLWFSGGLTGPPVTRNIFPGEAPRSPRARAATVSQPTGSLRINRKRSKFSLPNLLNALRTRSDSAPTDHRRPSFLTRFASKEKLKTNITTATIRSTSSTATGVTTMARGSPAEFISPASPILPRNDSIFETVATQVRAEMALDDFQFPNAITIYLSIPHSPNIMFNIAQLYLLMIDRDQARNYLREAVRLDDWFTVGWFQLAYVEFIEGRYPEALNAYIDCWRCMRSGRNVVYGQLGLDYTVEHRAVSWGLEATQQATKAGVYQAQVRPPSVPAGAIFRVNGRSARAAMARAMEISSGCGL
jgi:hypothetical protein